MNYILTQPSLKSGKEAWFYASGRLLIHPPAPIAFITRGSEQTSIEDLMDSINAKIHRDFEYDPYATSVQTTVGEMLRIKRGVRQDYANLMIAICRHKGIPARYVSGYHFVGDLQGGNADFNQASHARVECLIPGTGCWFGYDPTNNCQLDWRYIKLGHGRDYNDIVPVKGVYRGSSGQQLEVIVDVRLVEPSLR